jgi:hypothetical protein
VTALRVNIVDQSIWVTVGELLDGVVQDGEVLIRPTWLEAIAIGGSHEVWCLRVVSLAAPF